MKVISGFLKGRNIQGFDIEGTRPTMDRVKESTFATIQNNIKDSIFLDLFAGSGNIGIEAISNGSKLSYFIDNNKEAIKVIKNNITNLNILDKAKIILSDWKKFLNETTNKFDIIYVDPPYKYDVYEKIITKVLERNLLNSNGLLIMEYSNIRLQDSYDKLVLYRTKKYGNKIVNIYKLID